MNYFFRAACFEFAKILSNRLWWIVLGIVLVIQPLLALLEAVSLAQIGITATPETHPGLAQILPPLDYFGFDIIPLGQAAIVVLGGIGGASIYRGHELRTTLLVLNKRKGIFLAKLIAILVGTIAVSFISVFITISITHIGLGGQGLHPLTLSSITWAFIGYATLNWVLLAALSFGIGLLFRNAIVPLILMVSQVVGLGGFLAQKWEWGGHLPVAAGNLLFATPASATSHDPVKGGLILMAWTVAMLVAAAYCFVRRDVGDGTNARRDSERMDKILFLSVVHGRRNRRNIHRAGCPARDGRCCLRRNGGIGARRNRPMYAGLDFRPSRNRCGGGGIFRTRV